MMALQNRCRRKSRVRVMPGWQVEVLDAKTRKQICFLDKVEPYSTIADIKSLVHKSYPQWYPARQALKLDPKAKALRDEEVLQSLPVGTTATMYFRDLGPQLGWTMVERPRSQECFIGLVMCVTLFSQVFLAEYMGPLFTYLMFYFRLPFIYPHRYAFTSSPLTVTTLACACHTGHYMKRLVETIFVHRFSHGTMPLRTIIRNCVYYWGFSAWLAYYINHPLYTPPYYGDLQINSACALFVLCEVGNFSIHLTLNSLKGEGTKVRNFPTPTRNPFTWLFFFVSCPNYTYEVGAWLGFSIMTQCLPVALYTLLSFIQMSVWARGKHRAYTREFKAYPGLRMAIVPLVL
ncbi:very-long-chain enoyl-CoA reductase-like [Gadus chalcogrammus]|uniref:very-long-chain enoyl-CoA reductase-like n=1 Tax=Gadus chalcogrammus TaxID=1042646 RepID=UPI0024C49786|nr:very-long-chain enoyl-CoA reductase-like [Gadus chalcogrammus]